MLLWLCSQGMVVNGPSPRRKAFLLGSLVVWVMEGAICPYRSRVGAEGSSDAVGLASCVGQLVSFGGTLVEHPPFP